MFFETPIMDCEPVSDNEEVSPVTDFIFDFPAVVPKTSSRDPLPDVVVPATSCSTSNARISRPCAFNVKPSPSVPSQLGTMNKAASASDEYDSFDELPTGPLDRLIEQLSRQRWVVPVLPKQELEVLMEIAICMIRKGKDTCSHYFDAFLDRGLIVAYDKLMRDEAMKEWKLDIHRFIWLSVARYYTMFTEKLRQTLDPEEIHPAYWTLLHQTMSSCNRFFLLNYNRSAEILQVECDLTELNRYTYSVDDTAQIWHRMLLHRFGSLGGFELMKAFLEKNVNDSTTPSQFIQWLLPFASCAGLLKSQLITSVFQNAILAALSRLRMADSKELKCESVKGDFRDSPYMELPRVLHAFLLLIPDFAADSKEMQFFSLKYILRVLQVAPFAGRIAALEELHAVLQSAYCDLSQPQCSNESVNELTEWIHGHSVIEILFRDNLHHPSFCERLERVMRVLLEKNAVTSEEMDTMWNAQRGKHDVIQRNLHDLLAKLANAFNNELQEQLFALMKESWADSSSRERTLLLDLIRRIGIDFSDNCEKTLTLKSLSLLWDLFRDEDLSVDMRDAALDAHFTVIESTARTEDIRKQYINRCIDELLTDSVFVLPALKQMQRILMLTPDCSYATGKKVSRNEYIATVQQDTELCSRLSRNLALYMEKVRSAVSAGSVVCSDSDAGNLMIDGRYTHEEHLRIRLAFLHFLLSDGQLWLMTPQANEVWDALIVNSVFEFERTFGFQLFANMQEQEDIDPKALDLFFSSRVLKLPVELLNEEGFSCFKTFWTSINKRAEKLFQPANSIHFLLSSFELKGYDYLWEIILKSRETVSRLATDLWVDIFSNPHTDVIDVAQLNEFVISKCFVMLKENQDELIRGGGDDAAKMLIIKRMSRILFALHCYICAFDDDCSLQELTRPPLLRACIGRCFRVTVVLPASSTMGCANEDYSPAVHIEIPVHSNMPISALKLLIEERLREQERCNFDGDLVRFQLGIRIGLLGNETKYFDSHDRRKTLGELLIDEKTEVIVRFSYPRRKSWSHGIISHGIIGADSSPELSEDITPTGEEDFERLLPGAAVAANSDHVRFLYTLADIGYAYACSELRDAAEKVLKQIPADAMSVSILRGMVESERLSDLLPAETPSRALHLLRVLHSLLLPANLHTFCEINEFQRLFFLSSSCLAVFTFLEDPKLLHRWDSCACRSSLWWLLSIATFVLSVAARVKAIRKNCDSRTLHGLDQVLDEKQSLFKEVGGILFKFCDVAARDLCSYASYSETEEQLEHLEQLSNLQESHLNALLRIAWAVGSRRLPLVDSLRKGDSSAASIAASAPLEEMSSTQEELALCALDALGCATVFEEDVEGLLRHADLWKSLVIDLLLSCSGSVRQYIGKIIRRIVCRSGTTQQHLSKLTIDLLFEKCNCASEKPEAAAEFFALLCRLLEYCRNSKAPPDQVASRMERTLEWLVNAKQHTIAHMESYPNDTLLVGYFDLCRCLTGFLTPEQKWIVGSDRNGRQLVKQLLDEFVLPSSRAFLELERCREDAEGHIQRSVTHSAISSRSGTANDYANSIPRSATMGPMSASRCVPVCGTPDSVKAAYDLLVALCEDSPQNYCEAVETLMNMFYSGPLPVNNIDWEYLPGFTLRMPNSYVGLKNGGATCYMNSVFQQLFMIERLRNAVINANCEGTVDADEGADDRISLFREPEKQPAEDYHPTILKAIQSIFAHLLGSELQFYTPRYFWNHFRFGGQPVNVREQQDALEFYNAIFDSIDEGLKRSGSSPICGELFGGTFADQKICKDCPHRYQREEPFTSISVDIRSHNNLIDSLKEYVKGDLLNNDNAYLCEECNRKVTAVKRLCLAKTPPYLTIQLKRFDFDWERNVPQKYNDYFEFPLEFDMMPYTAQGLANAEANVTSTDGMKEVSRARSPPSAVDSGNGGSASTSPEKCCLETCAGDDDMKSEEEKCTKYRLRGVIVHSGQANGGHYYSYIRSEEDGGRWFKFDDVDVTDWQLSNEEMRNMWFGGDYVAESYDNNSNRYQKRRQKRWWNAYLLIYEKAVNSSLSQGISSTEMTASCSSALAASMQSPLSSSISPPPVNNLVKRFSSMSLSTRIKQMPPKLEALIRGKNTRSMHERSQYTPQYFQLMKELTSLATKLAERNASYKEELCLLAMRLLSKFLFSTGLRAKKSLRGGNMCEWQKTIETLFMLSWKCRAWFVCNVIFQPKLIVTYLLVASSTDVRYFFAAVMVSLLNTTRHDDVENLRLFLEDCPEFSLDLIYRRGDSISDLLITLLLIIPKNSFSEFNAHPVQYCALFHQYVILGHEQKKQMVKQGALYTMLILVSRDDYRIKVLFHDTAKLYEFISLLLRTCDFYPDNKEVKTNPYSVLPSDLVPVPSNVAQLMQDAQFAERLLKQLLEMPSDHDIAIKTLQFLSWENIPFSIRAFQHIAFESMFTPNEVKNAALSIECLMLIDDSVKKERMEIALLGTDSGPKYKGYIATILSQKDIYTWKAYIMFKSLIAFLSKNTEAFNIVAKDLAGREELRHMERWLEAQITHNSNMYNYGCRSNEVKTSSGIERTESANDLIAKCREINNRIKTISNGEVSGGERPVVLPPKTGGNYATLPHQRPSFAQTTMGAVHTRSLSDVSTERSPVESYGVRSIDSCADDVWESNRKMKPARNGSEGLGQGHMSGSTRSSSVDKQPSKDDQDEDGYIPYDSYCPGQDGGSADLPPPAYTEVGSDTLPSPHPNSPVHATSWVNSTWGFWRTTTTGTGYSTGTQPDDSPPDYEEAARSK